MEAAPTDPAGADGIVIDDAIGEVPPVREEEDLPEPALPERAECARPPAVDSSTFVTGVDEIPLLDTTTDDTFEAAPESPPLPTHEDVELALNALLKRGTIPTANMRQGVAQLASRRKLEALLNSNYRLGQKYEDALTLVRQYECDEAVQENRQQLEERQRRLEARREQINAEYDARIQKAQDLNAERYDELVARQTCDLEEFKGKWQDPDFLRQYSHPSTRLLQLRQAEKKLALSGRYDDAKKTKAMADRLQAQEEEAMQGTIEGIMRKEFVKLREQQKQETVRMVARDDKALNEVETQRQRTLEPIQAAAKRLLHTKQNTAVTRFRGVRRCHETAVTSPRTRSEFKKYRETAPAQLNFAPVDDATFDQLTKRTRSRHPSAILPALTQ
jgi:hypothetical protein